MSKKILFRKIIVVIIGLILVISTVFYVGLKTMLDKFNKEVSMIEINNVDVSSIEDGVYTGKFFANDSVGAIVDVTINNRKITNIDFIQHKYGRGKKAETITNKVIDKQNLNVDIISGATCSSIIILKAIENALSIESHN